jgi:hypothetical protein
MPTEKQAAEMWCPFVRLANDRGTWNRGLGRDPINTDGNVTFGNFACNCLGARCMAWRWREAPSSPDRTGCCGLAGDGYIA